MARNLPTGLPTALVATCVCLLVVSGCNRNISDDRPTGAAVIKTMADLAANLSGFLDDCIRDTDQRLLTALSEAESELLYFQRPLTLPTSYLLDADGKLAVIYKGAVHVKQVLEDVALISTKTTSDSLMPRAFPFPGRSGLSLFPLTATDVARAYREGGYHETAEEELIRYLVETKRKLNKQSISVTASLKEELEDAYHELASLLADQRRYEEAKAVAGQGMQFFPRSSRLREFVESN